MFDVLIIGGGPAGLTATIYASRANLKVGLIEGNAPGGQMVNTPSIENYPGYSKIDGASLSMEMFNQVMNLNVEYIAGYATNIKKEECFLVTVDNNIYQSKTVIIATGTRNNRLNVLGEDKFAGFGISWCAICDGALYKDRNVAVIGGGNSSLSEAIYLSKLVNKVYLIHRRNEFRAEETLQQKVRSINNIEIITNVNIIEFTGDKKLEKIVFEDKLTSKKTYLSIDGCFEYIGQAPVTTFFDFDIIDESGYIIVNKNCETKIEGLFACGDVIQKDIRQIVTAVNDGAIASLNASKYCK